MENKSKILELMQNDTELQDKLMHCTSKSQAIETVQAKVPEATKEDIDQAVKEILKKLNEMQTKYLEEEEKKIGYRSNGNTVTTATTVTTITAAASSYAFI